MDLPHAELRPPQPPSRQFTSKSAILEYSGLAGAQGSKANALMAEGRGARSAEGVEQRGARDSTSEPARAERALLAGRGAQHTPPDRGRVLLRGPDLKPSVARAAQLFRKDHIPQWFKHFENVLSVPGGKADGGGEPGAVLHRPTTCRSRSRENLGSRRCRMG